MTTHFLKQTAPVTADDSHRRMFWIGLIGGIPDCYKIARRATQIAGSTVLSDRCLIHRSD
jgi:hypothetical protein